MRCLFEVCMRRGWAGLTDKALMLSKCVVRRMWGSQTPLRQFKGIPGEILTKVGSRTDHCRLCFCVGSLTVPMRSPCPAAHALQAPLSVPCRITMLQTAPASAPTLLLIFLKC
jgi:hypothetical protein